ncbi:transcriptional regulator [Yaniella flava]|uniref:Transcriptional regulator n=1 Tax=Yaniella flava TaxID=287930 RepID=A0ABP5FEX5_9MICC|nr:transcriptional regulator [Micrococcaceae bacterium]
MSAQSNAGAFNELIHAPMRLRICASLSPLMWAEFAQLRDSLDVADSVLSKHLKQLSDAGYVSTHRFLKGGRNHTRVALTASGRQAYVQHVNALRQLTEER